MVDTFDFSVDMSREMDITWDIIREGAYNVDLDREFENTLTMVRTFDEVVEL